jgi:hypothetical protein
VAFTILFYWLLMIILIVLFFSGGLMYTEVCRPIINKEDTGVLSVNNSVMLISFMLSTTWFQIANALIKDSFEDDLGVTVSQLLK